MNDTTPVNEVEMSALLERAFAHRPGVTRLRMEDGDIVLLAGTEELRFGIAMLTRQMNGFAGAKQRQAALDTLLKKVDETVAGKNRPKPEAEQQRFRKALLPVLKNRAYIAESEATARKQGLQGQLLYVPLAGDIVVLAALDLPKITRFVRVGEGGAYGMKDEDVFKLAFDNLSRRVDKLQLQEFGPVRVFDFENDYNASLLLVPAVWKSVPDLPRKVAITVPARDVVAFADADDPQALTALRGIAAMPDNGFPVSRLLFLRTERGLEVMP